MNLVNGYLAAVNGQQNGTPANHYRNVLPVARVSRPTIAEPRNDLASKQPKIINDFRNNLLEMKKAAEPKRILGRGGKPIDHRNGINRSVVNQNAVNERLAPRRNIADGLGISVNLRQLLRPTVVQKRQENFRVEYDPEDINGPYNFRQLLRPAEYLPTESLRKRKGGLACNGAPVPRDKVPEKHVKRRAPLAPNQNQIVNPKK